LAGDGRRFVLTRVQEQTLAAGANAAGAESRSRHRQNGEAGRSDAMTTQTTTSYTQQTTPPRFSWRWLLFSYDGVCYRGRRVYPSEDKARAAYEKAQADRAICYIVENGPVKNVLSVHDGSKNNTGIYKDDVVMFIPITEKSAL
jgi:hypothetical protein